MLTDVKTPAMVVTDSMVLVILGVTLDGRDMTAKMVLYCIHSLLFELSRSVEKRYINMLQICLKFIDKQSM